MDPFKHCYYSAIWVGTYGTVLVKSICKIKKKINLFVRLVELHFSIFPYSPSNWRGASMVAAARRTNKEKTSSTPSSKTNSFYGSNTPPPDTFHTHSLGKQQEGSGTKHFSNSARRSLALDLEYHPSQKDGDDFQQTPNYR